MAVHKGLLILCLVTNSVWAQTDRYFISFKDKSGTPHTITQPTTFLSARAMTRRSHSGVAVTSTDLPVTPSYVSQIKATGAKTFFTSRWMNGVLVEANSSVISTIALLPFVLKTELVAHGMKLLGGRQKQFKQKNASSSDEVTQTQLQMLGIDKMHDDGFRGEGVMISVLDDGFSGVNSASPFQLLFSEGRIKMTQDFVTNSGNVFQFDSHGTEVLSILAAQVTGTFTAGADKANYLLFVTEDNSSEFRVEEYNWLFAAEKSDSAGADVIQSSLGYNKFDDAQMDYTVANMDGKTTVIAKAAGMARDRAIIVVVSAGNEGNTSWHYVTSPGDVDGILAIGSVSSSGSKSNFSSFGPTADGRIKPDVVALGQNVIIIHPDGSLGNDSGTSMSSPLVAGLAAGLVQAFPQLTPAALIQAIKLSASQAATPDNRLGYGIPNYTSVKNYINSTQLNDAVLIYPNPAASTLMLAFKELPTGSVELAFYDSQGKLLSNPISGIDWLNNPLSISLSGLAPGCYFLKIKTPALESTYRFVKL